MDTPTVYVIDASAAVRNSVSVLLQQLDIRAKYFADEKNFLNEPRPLPTPRCLIADLNLAAMNGIELMQLLQQSGSPTPTIILSNDGDVPTAVHALRAGAVDYFEKPFVDCVLLERVKVALGLTAGLSSRRISE